MGVVYRPEWLREMGVRNKEGTGIDGLQFDQVANRRLSAHIVIPCVRCDWLSVDCTHKFLAGTQDEYIKHTAGRVKRQRRLYSHGLSILPFDMTFSQSCSVLPFLAIFWNSNVVKWLFLSF